MKAAAESGARRSDMLDSRAAAFGGMKPVSWLLLVLRLQREASLPGRSCEALAMLA